MEIKYLQKLIKLAEEQTSLVDRPSIATSARLLEAVRDYLFLLEYSNKKENKRIWTNNKFKGHCPVNTAAVVVAKTKESAADYLTLFLNKAMLPGAKVEDMKELPFVEGQVAILNDGEY